MSEPATVCHVTEWQGCYSDSWQHVITPDSFAHPAKFARGLIHRIYAHMIERGYIAAGDSVVDPFGGIAAGAYDALLFGLHWVGVELEERFCLLGNANIDKYRHDLRMLNGRLGSARLLQGDSRRLVEVVGAGMGAVVSSPPYIESINANDAANDSEARQGRKARAGIDVSRSVHRGGPNSVQNQPQTYGSTPGQLGSMPSGDYAAVVSSPPFSGDKNLMAVNGQGVRSDMMQRHGEVESQTQTSYGNLATLRADDAGFSAAVSSPPYADAVNGQGEGPGARHDPIYHNGDNAYKASSANGYGETPGNLGSMAGEGFGAAVSSPPFEDAIGQAKGGGAIRDENKAAYNSRNVGIGRWKQNNETYGDHPANIGNDTGETFWSAARQIVEQTYQVLKPGGYAAWVCKDFVRRGQRVPFSDQWEALCAAVGFERVERIHALLVEDHGEQLDIFGGAVAKRTERKSFFRRLAEKKGSPRIDHEDVIIMRKPL